MCTLHGIGGAAAQRSSTCCTSAAYAHTLGQPCESKASFDGPARPPCRYRGQIIYSINISYAYNKIAPLCCYFCFLRRYKIVAISRGGGRWFGWLSAHSMIRACAHYFLSSVNCRVGDSLRCISTDPSVVDIDRCRRCKDGDGVAATGLMEFLHCLGTIFYVGSLGRYHGGDSGGHAPFQISDFRRFCTPRLDIQSLFLQSYTWTTFGGLLRLR